MKKKIVAFTLVIAMLAIALIGGTMAYFTDTDAETNTFTVGNVAIRIDEWMENANDEWVEYVDQKLSPIAQTKAPFNKLVETVNTGADDAYIRTFITCPAELWDELGYGFNTKGATGSTGNVGADHTRPGGIGTMHAIDGYRTLGKATVDGEEVYIFVCDHKEAIAPKDSILSLTKVWVYDTVDNADIGDNFEVKVYSEAIQAANLSYEEAMASLNGGKTELQHAADLFNGN